MELPVQGQLMAAPPALAGQALAAITMAVAAEI
jgi:hypothetical protein